MINWKNPINHPVSQQALLTMSTHRHLDLHLYFYFSPSLLIFYPSFPLLPSYDRAIKTPLFIPTRWTWTVIVSMTQSHMQLSKEISPFDLHHLLCPGFSAFLFQLIHPPLNSYGCVTEPAAMLGKGQADGGWERVARSQMLERKSHPRIPVDSCAVSPAVRERRGWRTLNSASPDTE